MVKSKNNAVVVGEIVETNFKFDPDATNLFDNTIKGAYVRDDFKNPAFLRVKVERHDDANDPTKVTSTANVRVNMYNVFKEFNKKDGSRGVNSTFNELKKISEAPNGGVGLPIKIKGTYGESKYATDDGQIKRGNVFTGQYIELSNVDLSASKADAELTGIIGGIRDEVVSDNETGRKLVDFYTVRAVKDGVPKVDYMNLVVDKSLADAFESEFEHGDSATLSVEIKDVQHGSVKKESKGFGSRSAETTSGYLASEFQIFNGSVLDDSDAGYIDEDEFQTILKAHDLENQSLIQKKMAKGGKVNTVDGVFTAEEKDVLPFGNTEEVNPFA
jgi:hypothetical protein